MGWEQRNGRSYYYRKVREDGRVHSEYMGSGLLAQMSAGEDNDKRRERNARQAAERDNRQTEAKIDRQLADVESALATMIHATLSAAGYHKHKGQWRKKRSEK
jgi:hypothetical protein